MDDAQLSYPDAQQDADGWLAATIDQKQQGHFAIEVNGLLAGGVGFDPMEGERRGSATFGYWLGRAYWGRGIGTDAARTLSDYALKDRGLRRLEAKVFVENVASAKVLQKCGFTLEGTLRALYVDRNESVCDALAFARFAERKTL